MHGSTFTNGQATLYVLLIRRTIPNTQYTMYSIHLIHFKNCLKIAYLLKRQYLCTLETTYIWWYVWSSICRRSVRTFTNIAYNNYWDDVEVVVGSCLSLYPVISSHPFRHVRIIHSCSSSSVKTKRFIPKTPVQVYSDSNTISRV